jgi:hypothetical protein
MADTKISALDAVTTPAVTDEFAINQGGASFKMSLLQVHTLPADASLVGTNAAGPSILNKAASGSQPTLIPRKDDLSTGIGAWGTGRVTVIATIFEARIGGNTRMKVFADGIQAGEGSQNPIMLSAASGSATVPNIVPYQGDINTGISRSGTDEFSIIAGGVNAVRYKEDSGVVAIHQLTSGITAGTTQTQAGATLLKSSYNIITTCANANDGAKMPPAEAGMLVFVANIGAETLLLWPNTDDLFGGKAADASLTMDIPVRSVRYFLAIDGVTWIQIALGDATP